MGLQCGPAAAGRAAPLNDTNWSVWYECRSVVVKNRFVFDLDKTERSGTLAGMPRDGTATRERILDVATDIAMDRGFAAASLDEVLGQSGVTKGAFYHYFDSKADLGRAILDRYATADLETLDRLWTQAEQLSRDPLQQLLLFVGLFANLDELATDDPGCLYATFIYERQLGVDGAIDVIEASIRAWRDRFRAKLDEVVERYPPRLDVDLDALSDLVFSTSEGAYIVARATRDPALVRGQLLQVRAYLELLFAPAPLAPPPRRGRGSGPSDTPAPRVDPGRVHGHPDEPGLRRWFGAGLEGADPRGAAAGEPGREDLRIARHQRPVPRRGPHDPDEPDRVGPLAPPGGREVLGLGLLPRRRPRRGTDVADRVPALDDEQAAPGVIDEGDVDRAPGLRRPGRQLDEPAIPGGPPEPQHALRHGEVSRVGDVRRRVACSLVTSGRPRPWRCAARRPSSSRRRGLVRRG